MRRGGLGAQHRRLDIGAHDRLKGLQRHLAERVIAADRRVIDQDVQAAESVERGAHQCPRAVRVGQVANPRRRRAAVGADQGGGFLGAGAVGRRVGDHPRAHRRQLPANLAADVHRRSGDNGDGAVER